MMVWLLVSTAQANLLDSPCLSKTNLLNSYGAVANSGRVRDQQHSPTRSGLNSRPIADQCASKLFASSIHLGVSIHVSPGLGEQLQSPTLLCVSTYCIQRERELCCLHNSVGAMFDVCCRKAKGRQLLQHHQHSHSWLHRTHPLLHQAVIQIQKPVHSRRISLLPLSC